MNQLEVTSQNQTKLLAQLMNQHEKDVFELKLTNEALNNQLKASDNKTISLENIIVELKTEMKDLRSGIL